MEQLANRSQSDNMDYKKISLYFLFITAFSYAVVFDNYANRVGGASYDYYFNTDVSFGSSSFTISAPASMVLSGTASDLGNGAIVCPTSLTIQPSSSGLTWGASTFDVHSLYPHPYGTFTPPSGCTASGRPARIGTWLDSGTFDSQKAIGTSGSYTTDSSNYNILAPFYDECVTYYDSATSVSYPNSGGEANVYCKGNYQISAGGTSVGSGSFSSPGSHTYSISSTQTITLSGSGLDCFAAVHKYPNTPDFRLYYFSYGFSGSIPSVSKTITVQNKQNSITCGPSNPASPINVPGGTGTLVTVLIRNNGNVINKVTSVTSSNSQVSATALAHSLCGGPVASSDPCCTVGNGFNQNINPGASKKVCVWLQATCTGTCVPYSTSLRFHFSTTSQVCNGKATTYNMPLTVNCNCGNQNVTSCVITPPERQVGSHQSAHFNLSCYDQNNTQMPCDSSVSWSLQNIDGFFWSPPTPTSAYVAIASPDGTTGTINAAIGSVSCISNITVNDSYPDSAHLELKPDTASLNVNDTQNFTTSCTVQGNPVPCSGVVWDPLAVLTHGDLSGSSDTGTTYTARSNGTDELKARADDLPDQPWDVSIINIGENITNCTNPPCPPPCTGPSCDHDGSSDKCTIFPNDRSSYPPGTPFSSFCGPDLQHLESCEVEWILDGFSYPVNYSFTLPGNLGPGLHTIHVKTSDGGDCPLDFNLGSFSCIEYS